MMGANKYGNKKTMQDGIVFASKKEANRHRELLLLARAGEISNLELQPSFELQEGFKCDGKSIRAINYIGDFFYTTKAGTLVVEDTKGFVTKDFALKAKLFRYKYRHITLLII